jgi:DNA-binding HxlR family transcriptional regulator
VLVGDRWSMLVLRELHFRVTRFNDILTNTGAGRAIGPVLGSLRSWGEQYAAR